ncbi:MAG: CpsD/CapB family tyrosine-protein kinase [Clostridia bacterium]|nr:CpsD/CapB family tyrosine-protein kinase [Clostridia bacterium]
MSIFKRKKEELVEFGILDENSPFALREAYSSLYTNIVYIGVDDKCKKLVVTSALPSEGKSTVSANLALTIAQNSEDKKVLLIDSDMRAPKISELFGIDEEKNGLSEFLAGVDEEPNFTVLEDKNLTILTSGAKSLKPTQLLSSSMMEKLFAECESEFDYIIIDTPPVNLVTDALMYNNYVNGYIISTFADHSDTKSLAECINRLNQVGAEIVGTVFSGAKLKSSSGKYKYSDKYNNYSGE